MLARNNLDKFTLNIPKYWDALVKNRAVKDHKKEALIAKISPLIILPLLPFLSCVGKLFFPANALELLHKMQIP